MAFVKTAGKKHRIDGSILYTGATGFVGCGVLFAVLALAEPLGFARAVLVVRRKGFSAWLWSFPLIERCLIGLETRPTDYRPWRLHPCPTDNSVAPRDFAASLCSYI